MNFINFVVLPYWRMLNTWFNDEFKIAIGHLEENKEKWKQLSLEEGLKQKGSTPEEAGKQTRVMMRKHKSVQNIGSEKVEEGSGSEEDAKNSEN